MLASNESEQVAKGAVQNVLCNENQEVLTAVEGGVEKLNMFGNEIERIWSN